MTVLSINQTIECTYRFLWKTPYACSQCRLNQTTKYYGACHNNKRTVFLEINDYCILNSPEEPFESEVITLNKEGSQDIDIKVIDGLNVTEDGFVFAEEYEEFCSEVAVSYIVLLILLILLLVILITASIIIVMCLRHRKRYYNLLNEKEPPRDQEQIKDSFKQRELKSSDKNNEEVETKEVKKMGRLSSNLLNNL